METGLGDVCGIMVTQASLIKQLLPGSADLLCTGSHVLCRQQCDMLTRHGGANLECSGGHEG